MIHGKPIETNVPVGCGSNIVMPKFILIRRRNIDN